LKRLRLLLTLLGFCFICLPGTLVPARAASSNLGLPSTVWGQPDFASGACRQTTALTLCGPTQAIHDAQGNLWVADYAANRVVMYPPGSTVAQKVFGQYGSFGTRGCNQAPPAGHGYPRLAGGGSRYTLCEPIGIAVDGQGTLYVADSINNRVLIYFHAASKPADAPADRVLGQAGFHATAGNDVRRRGASSACGTPDPASRCSLSGPMELSLDVHGNLLVPDSDNNRVLMYSAAALAHLESPACAAECLTPATHVWGQYGSFSTNAANNPEIPARLARRCTAIMPITHPDNACTLSEPWAAIADAQGDLFVSDTDNNRILEYGRALVSGRQAATTSYGQGGHTNTAVPKLDGLNASSLWHPMGLAFDPSGNLWAADFYNQRVLEYPPPGAAGAGRAIQVLGQQGRFDTSTCGLGRQGLCGPTSISFDAAGDAYIVDGLNSRLLEYIAPGP
jgi:DNA-binding beta-propeller fold protein YncE